MGFDYFLQKVAGCRAKRWHELAQVNAAQIRYRTTHDAPAKITLSENFYHQIMAIKG